MYHDDTTPGSVVQALDTKRLPSGNLGQAAERFKLVVSDGQHYQQAVVVTELNARILSGEVQTLGLIKLTEVFCKVVQNRSVIIILGLEVVPCPVGKLGKPSNVDSAGAATSASGENHQEAKPAPAASQKPTPAVNVAQAGERRTETRSGGRL